MAIKITTDSIVKPIRPDNSKIFTIDELNGQVGDWIDPFKVGPVWVMSAENSKKNDAPKNELASFFFEVALYGDVLIVPPQQLPSDWDLPEDEDMRISSDMVDSGFLLSLQNAIMVKKIRDANPGMNVDSMYYFNEKFNEQPKEEYMYDPPTDQNIDSNTADFFEKVYEFMTKAPAQFKKGILLEETQVTIITQKENLKKILTMMKGMYLESEEYEKCSVIQQVEEQCN